MLTYKEESLDELIEIGLNMGCEYMLAYQKYASRNVQKGVQGDGQRNGQNCIAGGALSTTTCFKCNM